MNIRIEFKMFDYLTNLFKNYIIEIVKAEIDKESNSKISNLRVKKLSDNAIIPIKTSSLAAGYDLFSSESKIVKPHTRELISTDISIEVPTGTYGHIVSRSGLALKKSIDIGAGIIDADFSGPIGVIVINNSDEDFEVEYGMRIAQLICEKIVYPEIEIISEEAIPSYVEKDDVTNPFYQSLRSPKGFGSSGIF